MSPRVASAWGKKGALSLSATACSIQFGPLSTTRKVGAANQVPIGQRETGDSVAVREAPFLFAGYVGVQATSNLRQRPKGAASSC